MTPEDEKAMALEAFNAGETDFTNLENMVVKDVFHFTDGQQNIIRKALAPAPVARACCYAKGFYDGWMGCGVFHVHLDFEDDNEKEEVKRRVNGEIYKCTCEAARKVIKLKGE